MQEVGVVIIMNMVTFAIIVVLSVVCLVEMLVLVCLKSGCLVRIKRQIIKHMGGRLN